MNEILTTTGLSLLGTLTHIFYRLYKEGNKYENKRANFNAGKYVSKNKFDFIFYVLAGLVTLTIKSVVADYIGVEGLTDTGLSVASGLLGSVIIEKLLNRAG